MARVDGRRARLGPRKRRQNRSERRHGDDCGATKGTPCGLHDPKMAAFRRQCNQQGAAAACIGGTLLYRFGEQLAVGFPAREAELASGAFQGGVTLKRFGAHQLCHASGEGSP